LLTFDPLKPGSRVLRQTAVEGHFKKPTNMKELNKKGEAFYRLWEKKREKKWLYVFVHGSVYWGLPVAIGTFLLSSHFEIENMSISKLLFSIILFMIGGIGFGLSQFKRIDNIYLGLNDDNEIKNGIQTIENGGNWNYENLIIRIENDDTLNIQNQLFWFEEKDVTSNKIVECFNLVEEDFQRLKKNRYFEQFLSNRKVTIQIMDNSDRKTPLMEKHLV
jgi:hypothetical protein